MIGRGKRYPLVRHVTEDEIGRGLFRSRRRTVQLERDWLDRRFVRLKTQGGAAFAALLPLALGYDVEPRCGSFSIWRFVRELKCQVDVLSAATNHD